MSANSGTMEQLNLFRFWIYCSSLLLVVLRTSDALAKCSFPEEWHGMWYQEGLGEVKVDKDTIDNIGHCIKNDNNKYLLLNGNQMCFKCVAFTPQHKNLLQYKMSYCMTTNDINELCDTITGDFTLHTMVKVSGNPIECPFQGNYIFSYTNGSDARCESPSSSINACADDSQFLFDYQKCPRVSDTHNKTESFQCLATWNNGVDHYLYGKFSSLAQSSQSQYKCFMYSIYGTQGYLSMTADATCQGLQSPTLGMYLYQLEHKTEEWPQPICQFPEFFSSRGDWQDVSSRYKYVVNKREDGFQVMEIPDPNYVKDENNQKPKIYLRVKCIAEVDSVDTGHRKKAKLLAFVTDDTCKSSYRCLRFIELTTGVVEIHIGQPTVDTESACTGSNFRGVSSNVLISYRPATQPCPIPGRYSYVDKNSDCNGILDIGCALSNEIGVDSRCTGKESADVLECYATWAEKNMIYIIAGRVGDPKKISDCLAYKVTANGYELEGDPRCGPERLRILGKPVSYIFKGDHTPCGANSQKTSDIISVEPKEPRDKTRVYNSTPKRKVTQIDVMDKSPGRGPKPDNRNMDTGNVIDTPPSGGSQSGIINKSNSRTSVHMMLCTIACLVVFFLQR